MLKDKLIYIFLFFSFLSFGQNFETMLIASKQQAGSGGGSELYVTANALSETNETNATTGLSPVNLTDLSSVANTDSEGGSYEVSFTGDTGGGRFEIDLTLDPSTSYTVVYRAKVSCLSCGLANNWTGSSGYTLQFWTTTYTEYTQNITTDGTGVVKWRFYVDGGQTAQISLLSLTAS